VTNEEYANRWDAIFGRDIEKKKAVEEAVDELVEEIKPEEKQNGY
jgi:hypothetical protein